LTQAVRSGDAEKQNSLTAFHNIRNGVSIEDIGPESDLGPYFAAAEEIAAEDIVTEHEV
jgi:hypothetical protein